MVVLTLGLGFGATLPVFSVAEAVLFHEPTVIMSIAAIVGLVSLAACWVPALRAYRVDPVRTLRPE